MVRVPLGTGMPSYSLFSVVGRTLRNYSVAVVAAILAVGVRMALDPVVGPGAIPYFTLLPTAVLVGLYAGFIPALVTVGIGELAVAFLILAPKHSFEVAAATDRAGLAVFALFGSAAAFLARTVHRSKRAAEASLRDARLSEARFRSVVEHVNAGLVQADASGRMVLVNEHLCRMLGYDERELLALTIADVTDITSRSETLRELGRLANGGPDFTLEQNFRHKDGTPLPASCSVTALRDADGQFRGFVGVVLDITERRRAEAELRDADRRKDEFLAILAHELRNPLAPIRTGLELLKLSPDRPATIARVQPMLERQVGHMVRLIDDLLDISRITSGRIHLQRQPTPLADLVHSAVETSRAAIEAAELDLVVTMPEEPCVLDVDPTRFVQVLSNVLHNAAKFTDRGGRVSVTASLDRAAYPRELSIAVRDSGAGISPAMLPRVFDLFVQGASAGRGRSGLGIGLALARQLLEMHGGRIDAHSDGEGKGSTFTIRIPATTAANLPGVPPQAVESERLDRRVLVVDDNVDAAETVASLIRSLGGTAETAHDGETGLSRASSFLPDAILLDIGMPGIDGYDTCRRLRQEPFGRGVYIVALTGWGQPQDRERAFAAGFDAHLTKPADPKTLAGLLRNPSPSKRA